MIHKIKLYLIKNGFILSEFRKSQIPYQKFKKRTKRGRYFVLGFCIGLTPYVVHMNGWLR